jgi:hypothetical protein
MKKRKFVICSLRRKTIFHSLYEVGAELERNVGKRVFVLLQLP